MNKRIIALLLSVLLLIGCFAGCGNNPKTAKKSEKKAKTSSSSENIDSTSENKDNVTDEDTNNLDSTDSTDEWDELGEDFWGEDNSNNDALGDINDTDSDLKNDTNYVNLPVYNLSSVKNKLGVWMFSMPSEEEHTGDCMLIRSPTGKTMLIDTGSSQGGEMVLEYLKQMGILKIDVLLITHMHSDHVGGSLTIMDETDIGSAYGSPLKDFQTLVSRRFRTELRKRNIPYIEAYEGMKINLDKGIDIEVLHPQNGYTVPDNIIPEEDGNFTNDSSVVVKLTYRKRSFLFTGDIESPSEELLVNKMASKLKCDVLKVPHHGASTSSTEKFIKAVNAEYAVITTYAFNDFDVLDRYKSNGTKPFITSLDGTIMFVTDGNDLKFSTDK